MLSVVGRFRFGFGFENQSAFFANHFPAIGELAANSQVAYVRTVFGNHHYCWFQCVTDMKVFAMITDRNVIHVPWRLFDPSQYIIIVTMVRFKFGRLSKVLVVFGTFLAP